MLRAMRNKRGGHEGNENKSCPLRAQEAVREPHANDVCVQGQFVVYKPHPDHPGPEHVIQQCPSQFSKGVIIWTTVFGLVVVGPTAQPQKSRTDR